MIPSRRTFVGIAASLLAIPLAMPVQALSNRVFVSTSGSDGNDCSDPLNPCRYIARALSQVTARGEVIALASGGYGTITITQSVTISGPSGVVIFSNFPVTVAAGSSDTVVLRGLTIDGTGTLTGSGINVTSVGKLHVESCVVTGFLGGGGADGNGILFQSPGRLFVTDTIVRENGAAGITLSPTTSGVLATIDHCRLERNSEGVVVDGSGGGAAAATVRDSVASGNKVEGFRSALGELNLENCLSTDNGIGILSTVSSAVVRVSNCTITSNVTGLNWTPGAQILSRSNNTLRGNGTNGGFTGTFTAD